ncbi:major facilitator superfamily domain-containing protein [Aspergillus venezuelensis]
MAVDNIKTAPIATGELEADFRGASDTDNSDKESLGRAGFKKSTFSATEDPRFYRPVDSYEGLHRWDPYFDWTEEEEQKIVRKIDLRFFALQLDRGNISQALADTLLKDLNMTSNDYNTGQTIFLCCFLFAELPSQLISKRLGPDHWIPIQMVAWSLVASCQAFLKTRAGYLGLRAMLGLLEGGFFPDTILFLSFFYKSSELPKRLTCFWATYTFTSIIGAFLAFGLLHITDSNGGGSWRYLFAYEGLITGVVGIIAALWMPASPTQTIGGFRGKDGWFTEHEEKIMVNRVIRDDPSKGSMHNRQAVTPRLLWESLKDYHMWPIYILGFIWMIPSTPATNNLTLQLKNVHTVIVALTSRNAGSVRTHTVASALYKMSVQVSSIAGANVYRTEDSPYYRQGNKVLIGLAVASMCLFSAAKAYYDWHNRHRRRNAAKWEALTTEQRETYLRENPVLNNKRIDFTFAS